MRFGFHIWISEGFSKVPELARKRRARTIQFFSHNPRAWVVSPLSGEEVKKFSEGVKALGIGPLFVHMPYLPNLSSSRQDFYFKSIDALRRELERAEILGVPFIITHMGSRGEASEAESIERLIAAINCSLEKVQNKVSVVFENTAGQGRQIGYKFSQIKTVIDGVANKERIGVCLDTAHAFQAGYDLSQKDGLENTLEEFERLIGFDKLKLLHLNDSKTPVGSRVDRHWHIGEGYIGSEGFKNIVNHPKLSRFPGIMETPHKKEEDDVRNMSKIESLVIPNPSPPEKGEEEEVSDCLSQGE
ncbi:MAG: deoxyribonuclease IV [Elusimicrobiota bacterium]|nr:deoxyribonuclease IV [Elusimicrobiota bacterium]MDH5661691.1 deoxyribonuclease IV [Elusimicrobiota bacterium]